MSISFLSFDRLSLGWKNSQFISLNQQYIRSSKRNQEPFHGRCHIRVRGICTSASIYTNAIGRSDHQKDFSSPCNEPFILEGSSMDEIYDALVQRLLPAAIETQSDAKYIIGLAGPPGAGKSTVSNEVVRRLNKLWLEKAYGMTHSIEPVDIAVAVPMDGFHLYRSQLDMMEDPKEAHARRGAPWTFDPDRLLSHLATLRRQGYVYMPSFDHGLGDPVEDDIFVSPLHKIVLLEGNYLLLEDGYWREVASIFDERWFLDIDIDLAMRRVEKRHLSSSRKSPEEAKWRVEYNDRKNAELIVKSRKNADLVIYSVEAPL
ncbi:hypothetical protein SUGI_1041730 [Cryptomeria japonica]|uniref:putative uridine kinase C227.14 isoform X2 n=1 Tax=Cryptomeria japonica TaxID=3369 RepID=UPI0024146B87|nr:putative uridine kinase C227.14 isoform X2 [Cryptomeria japonica]GLJ49289.1 hypothetical protein SUGI_1041730 [Cryptomeria japonica]